MTDGPVKTADGTVELDGRLGVAQALLIVTGETYDGPAQLRLTMDRGQVRALRDQCMRWLDQGP